MNEGNYLLKKVASIIHVILAWLATYSFVLIYVLKWITISVILNLTKLMRYKTSWTREIF